VEVVCWGGDADETSEIVYCAKCAAREWDRVIAAKAAREQEVNIRQAELKRSQSEDEAAQQASVDYWRNLLALPLETNCAKLFRRLGFLATTTAITNDGNIDIRLEKNWRRGAAQCKAWSKPCGVSTVREFLGTIYAEGLQFGYLIAKSGFTRRASILLKRLHVIEAWDLEELVRQSRSVESSR
jgi:hypothetical protein